MVGKKALKGKVFEESQPYLNDNYIFYPLHFEPETSTSVASYKMTNQVALIEQITKNMPFGFRLLVKEHLPSVGLRPTGFYDRIKSLPDVHLISPFEDPFNLIKKAKLVVVLTGTAGWESIMIGTPVLIFGQVEYTGIGKGFRTFNDIVNFEDDILEAMHTPSATETELVHFIAAQLFLKTNLSSSDMSAVFDNRKCDSKSASIYGKQLAKQILESIGYFKNKTSQNNLK